MGETRLGRGRTGGPPFSPLCTARAALQLPLTLQTRINAALHKKIWRRTAARAQYTNTQSITLVQHDGL